MKYLISPINGTFPALQYGPAHPEPRQLECFIPPGVKWRQLSFAAGEGRVEIEGCQWGFDYNFNGELSVILQRGHIDTGAALEFVRRVAQHVSLGEVAVRIARVDYPQRVARPAAAA